MGQRVGAICCSRDDGQTVELYGYGNYVGDFVPLEAVGGMAEMLKLNSVVNPKIVLDSGKVVYGCECWWGDEDKMKEKLKGKKIVSVDIDEVRAKYLKEEKEDEKESETRSKETN